MTFQEEIFSDLKAQRDVGIIGEDSLQMAIDYIKRNSSDFEESSGMSVEEAADLALSGSGLN